MPNVLGIPIQCALQKCGLLYRVTSVIYYGLLGVATFDKYKIIIKNTTTIYVY